MALDYKRRLENLQYRRLDPTLEKSILSESFSRAQIPEDLKYLAESMMPIDPAYNSKTITAAKNVHTHLERELKLAFSRDYRYQGSVMTKTNIRTFSDIDLLSIIGSYYYPQTSSGNTYEGDPNYDIEEFRKQIIKILKGVYDDVDDTGSKSISIYNKNLRRKVDIVPCYWYKSDKYEKEKDEFYKGVYLYDFEKHIKTKKDFPFAHISNVEFKGDQTNDGSRKGIRLIKNLKADSDERIDLSSFQLTTIVHAMDNSSLSYLPGSELTIAENISKYVGGLLNDPTTRKNLNSPNGVENPLISDDCISGLKELRKDLNDLIMDCKSDLRNEYFEKSIKNYK